MTIVDYLRAAPPMTVGTGPRYVPLRQRLSDAIRAGVLAPGAALPSEREIGALTELSRVTVRRAIQSLVNQGCVVQHHGSGTFVTDQAQGLQQSLSRLTSFSEEMAKRGMATEAQMLEQSIGRPSREEIAALDLAEGDLVTRLGRLRLANGRPLAIERASLPQDILPNPMAIITSLYGALERSNARPARAIQNISAINLCNGDAALLGVPPSAAGLRIERTSYLVDGRAIERTTSIFRGDAYDFVAELRL